MKGLLSIALLLAATPLTAATPQASPYRLVPDWPVYPVGVTSGDGSGIAVDGKGEVLALHRGNRVWNTDELSTAPIPVPVLMVFDGKSGRLLRQWGAGMLAMPHGISVDRADDVWITDVALHQVFKISHDGRLLMTLGERGVPGDDAHHFNRPTDVLPMADGSFYVTDGYRNTRVAKFSRDGRFQFAWGTPGSGPGAFDVPHSIALAEDGRLFVCDRNNGRIQTFSPRGRFVRQIDLSRWGRPFAIARLPNRRFAVAINRNTPDASPDARIAIMTDGGQVLSTFGGFGDTPGTFIAAHDIATEGNTIYVASVKGVHFQKFVPAR